MKKNLKNPLPEDGWLRTPGGLYVSAERMKWDGRPFRLYDADSIDARAFNEEAGQYGIRIEDKDPPIGKLVKCSLLLSRKEGIHSQIPTKREYVDILAAAMAAEKTGEEPLASFYKDIAYRHYWDAQREVLEFREALKNGKYVATLYRFNDDGILEPVADIVIPPEGWIRVLGEGYGYPLETGPDECFLEGMENPAFEDSGIRGYFQMFKTPEKGEMYIMPNDPCPTNNCQLKYFLMEHSNPSKSTTALRVKYPVPELRHPKETGMKETSRHDITEILRAPMLERPSRRRKPKKGPGPIEKLISWARQRFRGRARF